MTVFCDLDGVAVDLEAGYKRAFGIETNKTLDNIDWDLVRTVPGFFADLAPMPDFYELWGYIAAHDPVILTGVPKVMFEEASANKRTWVSRKIGEHVEVRCCPSSAKWAHCRRGDVLIDDWDKYKDRWVKAGGVFITHTSARDTIAKLKEIGL